MKKSASRTKHRIEEPRLSPGAVTSLGLVFLLMLAGRFSLGRFSPELSGLEARWIILILAFLTAGIWIAVERPPVRPRQLSAGLVWFVLWIVWMVLTVAWAPIGVDIGGEVESLILLGLGIICASLVMRRANNRVLNLVWWFALLVGLLYLADALVRGPDQFGRYAAFGGGPNVFVRIMILGAISTLALSIGHRRGWVLWLTPLFAFGAVLSGSRGGLLAAAVILLLGLVPTVRRLGWRRTLALLVLSVLLVSVVPIIVGVEQLNNMYQRLIVLPLLEGDASSRDVLAQRALGLFSENPIVGAGVGSVALQSSSGERGLHAHNLLLSTAAEAGFMGVMLLLFSLLAFFVSIIRSRPMSADALFAFGAALSIFIAALFSGDYYDSRFMWFFLLMSFGQVARSVPSGLDPHLVDMPKPA